MKKQKLSILIVAAALTASGSVLAHLGIAQENSIVVGDGSRQYKEGSTAFVGVHISHDCSNAQGEHFATTDVSLLLPNGQGLEHSHTSGSGGAKYGANAVMSVKQRPSSSFKKAKVITGEVGSFYSHGVKTNDARALKWLKGEIDNEHYENLEFKASFPKIDPESCTSKIRMYFPSVQYCEDGYKTAWIKTADSKYGAGDSKTNVTTNYAAYLDVVRTSALPNSCGTGEVLEVMPSIEEINKYLDRNKRDSDED